MKLRKLMSLFLAGTMLLSTALYSCTDSSDNTPDGGTSSGSNSEEICPFPFEVSNDKDSIDGGVLNFALVSSSSFAGVLNMAFYEDAVDAEILQWFTESILSADENFVFDQDGPATYTYDQEAKTVTIKLENDVKWHDGTKLTLDDLLFAYEIICHKDYKGLRYDEQMMNIEGVVEYHDGAADTISGLKLSDDKMSMTIQFKEFYPSILVGGFWIAPVARHYFEGIEVKDMAAHEKSRTKPLGFGPFKVKNVVDGESVEFERYDDYWRGTPKLDGVVVTLVNPELVPAAMEEGKFDVAAFSAQTYPDYMEPTNYQYIGQLATVFGYTGFNLGTYDADAATNVYNPDSKMADVKLRQAIGYAINNDEIGENLYNGLRVLATTVITPRHGSYQNTSLAGYTYDPDKSKQILDEAGYKDVDGDGYREDPDGNQFTISWAHMDGEGAQTLAQYKIDQWKEVGLRVELYNGRLTEFNAFYDAVEANDPKIDMYDGAWQTGFDPNPANLWGHESYANYTRYTSDKFDEIIKNISSDKAWDNDYLAQQYQDFQQAFFDEAPAIPTLWRVEFYAVNNRVKNYTMDSVDINMVLHLIELTDEKPVVK